MITLEFFGLVITLSCMLYGLNSMVRGFTQRKIEPESFWHGYVVTGFGCLAISFAATFVIIKDMMS